MLAIDSVLTAVECWADRWDHNEAAKWAETLARNLVLWWESQSVESWVH